MKRERRFQMGVLAALLCMTVCVAQAAAVRDDVSDKDKYLVSAKAGGINFVSGLAEVQRANAQEWQSLGMKDEVRAGDRVRTGAGGRVEMLLTPGSFLRLDENAEFKLTNSSLERLSINLLRGAVIIEALGVGDDAPLVGIATPHTKIAVMRSGIYRINAAQSETEVAVRKGRALVGSNLSFVVKGGRKIVTTAETPMTETAKLDKRERDEFDAWSKDRAEEIAAVNRKLSERTLRASLVSFASLNSSFTPSYRSIGFWVFNRSRNCYTFVPYSWDWASPYGGNYFTSTGFGAGLACCAGGNYGRGAGNAANTQGNTGAGGRGNNGGDGNNPPQQPRPSIPERERPPRDLPVREMPVREMPVRERPMMDAPGGRRIEQPLLNN